MMDLMRPNDNLSQSGYILLSVYYDGGRAAFYYLPNVITTIGKQRAVSHLGSAPAQTWFTHIALGDNSDTDVSSEDLALASETYRETLDTVWVNSVTVFGESSILASDIGAGNQTIRELGLLDAAVGGNLITHQNLATAITFSGAQRIDILWGIVLT